MGTDNTTVESAAEVTPALTQDPDLARSQAHEAARTAAEQQIALKAEMERAQAEIDTQKAALAEQVAALETASRAQMEALRVELAPLQEQAERAGEVINALDLYLGSRERVEILWDGEPADASTPIHVFQQVLRMDEEALYLGTDWRDADKFFEWITADFANVQQVLPADKSVVVVRPTVRRSQGKDSLANVARDLQNRRCFWLFRNGTVVSLMTTEDIEIKTRILPLQTEFAAFFENRFGKIEPGTDAWAQAERAASAAERHYLKIMLTIQGVIDRTTVFAPLPENGVNIMSMGAHEAGKVVIVADADSSKMLPDGRPPFGEWLKTKMAALRPGMRVIGNWNTREFTRMGSEDGWSRRRGNPRLSPQSCESLPSPGVPHLVTGRRDGMLVVPFDRTEQLWLKDPDRPGRETLRTPDQRGSVLVDPAHDSWVLPFDLMSLDEIRYYIGSRDARSQQLRETIPALIAARDAKTAEVEAESDFRLLLAGKVVEAGTDPDDADIIVDGLVHRWKIEQRWARPLQGTPDEEAAALAGIMRMYTKDVEAGNDPAAARVLESAQSIDGLMAVGRNRQGNWYAYAPTADAYVENVFMDRTRIYKNGRHGETDRWYRAQYRTAAALHLIYETDVWSHWDFFADPNLYPTGTVRQQTIDTIVETMSGWGDPICVVEAVMNEKRVFKAFWWEGEEAPETMGDGIVFDSDYYVQEPDVGRAAVTAQTEGGETALEWHKDSFGWDLRWGHYSDGHGIPGLGSVPWSDPKRSEPALLVWSNEDMFARLAIWGAEEDRRSVAREVKRREQSRKASRMETAILAALTDKWETHLRAEFQTKYGSGSEHLWEHHKETRAETAPARNSRTFRDAVQAAVDRQLTGTVVFGRLTEAASQTPYADVQIDFDSTREDDDG